MTCHDSPGLLASIGNSYDFTIGDTCDCGLLDHNAIRSNCNDKLKADNDYLKLAYTMVYVHAGHCRTHESSLTAARCS